MHRIVVAAWTLLLCLGCGDSGGDGGAGASGGGDFRDFTALACQKARHCCAEAGLSTTPLDDCEVKNEQSDFYKALERGTIVANEPAYSECLTEVRAYLNVCELSSGPTTRACLSILRGTVTAGGACNDAVECARSGGDAVACLRAGDAGDDEPGVCRPMVRGRAGDVCVFSTNERSHHLTYSTPEPDPSLVFCDAADGLYCAFPNGACTAFAAEGAPCTELEDCEPGLYCETTCKPTKALGSACTQTDECVLPNFCEAGVCTSFTYADTDICEGDID
jgi:hypothetical protein